MSTFSNDGTFQYTRGNAFGHILISKPNPDAKRTSMWILHRHFVFFNEGNQRAIRHFLSLSCRRLFPNIYAIVARYLKWTGCCILVSVEKTSQREPAVFAEKPNKTLIRVKSQGRISNASKMTTSFLKGPTLSRLMKYRREGRGQ